jgi:hypothetical protein
MPNGSALHLIAHKSEQKRKGKNEKHTSNATDADQLNRWLRYSCITRGL